MRVKFIASLRDYTNCPEADFPAVPTVGDLTRVLVERYGPRLGGKLLTPEGELGAEIVIMVNGRHVVHLGGMAAQLNEEDVVQLFPLVTGG